MARAVPGAVVTPHHPILKLSDPTPRILADSRLISIFTDHGIRYCLVGGQAANAYVEPVVSLDLDVVVATDQLPQVEALIGGAFVVPRFPHSLNASLAGSDLRVQFRTDPRYAPVVDRATVREVPGLRLQIACLDVLQGKLWAVMDKPHRPSKRQLDLADIACLLESYPDLRDQVPAEVLVKLV